MKLTPLRYLLIWDGALLLLLGCVLILIPDRVQKAFQFQNLPPAVDYVLALWGCALGTMGFGYLMAAKDPVRHVVWVQIGIVRGLLECLVGIIFITRGVTTFRQAGLGILLAGVISLAYIAFYPRQSTDATAT